MDEIKLMKGNEAIAEAAIRAGCDAYFGYPITPQSEVMEYLMIENPMERTGMVVLQAESETAAISMVFGAASAGKKAMTSSSSPGISLMQEGMSYLAGAEIPCLVVNVVRAGPGLGTIQPSQADYYQSTRGGGHGDYYTIVLAPGSVQEMSDFVHLGFQLAFRYRIPVLILSDGLIGQMMEKVTLSPQLPRKIDENTSNWAVSGKSTNRKANIITSLDMEPDMMEKRNIRLQEKYKLIRENEVRVEEYMISDANYILVAYGSSARVCKKVVQIARSNGHKLGLLRPITLFPFPVKRLEELSGQCLGFLSVEMNAGQMVDDIRLAVNGKTPVHHFGRYGGIVHSPSEVYDNFLQIFKIK